MYTRTASAAPQLGAVVVLTSLMVGGCGQKPSGEGAAAPPPSASAEPHGSAHGSEHPPPPAHSGERPAPTASSGAPRLSFEQAADRGMVGMASRKSAKEDADNRRFMILESMRNARHGGASVAQALDSCGGCTPKSAVVDPCEKPPNPSPDYTEYNAVRCGDLATIHQALHAPAPK